MHVTSDRVNSNDDSTWLFAKKKKRAKQVELVLKTQSLLQNILVPFHRKTNSTPPTLGKSHQRAEGDT